MPGSHVKNPVWFKALPACADPPRARRLFEWLAATGAAAVLETASPEQARILCALFSGSQALSGRLGAHPEWLALLTPEALQHPRRAQGLEREAREGMALLLKAGDFASALRHLREFKQREMLRIGARDLARLAELVDIMRELSDVADVCLDGIAQLCLRQLTERVGRPYHPDPEGRWQPTAFCVFGMGKLGGRELNYSSDVDVLFLYAEEGQVFREVPGKGNTRGSVLTNHQFFVRLAEMFVAEVSRMTAEGRFYRIDLRLRPEGNAGPLARSLAGYENYYAQWGQTWERMMLIKARCVSGDAALAAEFLEMAQPFRFPRFPGEGVLREVAAMKDRIEREVIKAGELDRNVKLGRGGIREVEFVAQTLQLLHAGRLPFLQGGQTLPVLEKLAEYGLLPRAEARALSGAYRFLREVEHRLQMEDDRQTHTIPPARAARKRLAALMGFDTLTKFEAARKRHTQRVRRVYDRLLKPVKPETRAVLPPQFEGAETEWARILTENSFQELDRSLRLLKEFACGPGHAHVSHRTVELAFQLLPRILALCPKHSTAGTAFNPRSRMLSDPDRVLNRLDSFISAYGARAMLLETWCGNPSLFELLLLLFDRSEFLAEAAIRAPDLVDELVLSGHLRRRKNAEEILKDLRHGRNDPEQRLWLRRYHRAELLRIGLRDILGLADFEQNLAEISALADGCLQYALEVTLRKHRFKRSPLVIIGLGKLGGAEINYGSDLDILFVTGSPPGHLPKLQRVAVEVMDFLSGPSELGAAFVTDARLRPDGEKGLLVNTLEAYEDYYRGRAQLWEIQSLTRARPVAGDMDLGRRFQEIAGALTDFTPANVAAGFARRREGRGGRNPESTREPTTRRVGRAIRPTGLAAYTPDWRQQIQQMRQRIEKERTPAGKDALAIKTGAGGLMDAEFLAQMFCLAGGWWEANTLRGLIRARDSGALPLEAAARLIENYRGLRRVEGILRRWSFAGETVLPEEEEPFRRVSIRCGYAAPEEFRRALAKQREAIHRVYNAALGAGQEALSKRKVAQGRSCLVN